MLRPLFWLIRWMFALALLAFMVAALRATLAPLAGLQGWGALAGHVATWLFLGGFAARWLLARLPDGDPLEFLDTLEHELTHAVAGYLTFAPPVSLTATLRGGGEVELKRSNPVAALAPYCLPLYAFLVALLTLVIRDGWIHQGQWAIAFVLGSFAWRLLREFHFGQTDFRAYGIVFSMVFIAGALPLCLLGVLDVTGLLEISWRHALRLFGEQAGWLWHQVRHATGR